jgi:hypothetical protein
LALNGLVPILNGQLGQDRDTLANLGSVAAAAIKASRPNGLHRILLPIVLGENFGRDIDWVFAYQKAVIAMEWRWFK